MEDRTFAQIVIRDIEPGVRALLRRRAKRHGRTLSEEIRTVLRDAVKEERQQTESAPLTKGLGTRIADQFADIGFTEEIPEWRGYFLRPAKFRRGRRVGKGSAAAVPTRSSRRK